MRKDVLGKGHPATIAITVMMLVSPFLLALTGCAQSSRPVEPESAKPDPVWPPPPQDPRVRFLYTIATPEDVGHGEGIFSRIWEFIRGPEDVSIRKPMGVAADGQGRIYVADPADKRIHRFDRQREGYEGFDGSGEKMWKKPMEVAVDAQDRLYVADSGWRRVFVLSPEGQQLATLGDGDLERPTGVAVDSERQRVYVTDTPEHDVKVFDKESGRLIKTIGERGNAPGTFNFPSYLNVGKKGKLYVTDSLNGRVQVFDKDGAFLRVVGGFGDGSGDFSAPKGSAVDSEGHLYVADAAFDKIQVFDQKGRLLLFFGSSGQGRGEFWMPTGLFIDDQNRIYVADSYNNRIQVFQFLGGAMP